MVKAGIHLAELHPIKGVTVICSEVGERGLAVFSQGRLVLVIDYFFIKVFQIAKILKGRKEFVIFLLFIQYGEDVSFFS